jgi:hypothetical protein
MQIDQSQLTGELITKAADMERQGKRLLDAAKKLRDAAAVLSDGVPGEAAKRRKPGRPSKKDGTSRLDQLKRFVRSRGDVSRKEAKTESGLPPGTVGSLLTRKYGFAQREDGRWTCPEATK